MPRHSVNRVLCLIAMIALATGATCFVQDSQDPPKRVGGGCDGCELMYEGMPNELGWKTSIANDREPREPLEIEGVIFGSDGKTPAPDVILYVYHTDAKGYYSPAPGQAHGRRHGRLRGWMKTNREGRYQFRTIRPTPYPNGKIPAHIHPIVKEPRSNEYYIDEYVFRDDPFVTKNVLTRMEARGGSGVVELSMNKKGVWVGQRDIILGRNIPHYE